MALKSTDTQSFYDRLVRILGFSKGQLKEVRVKRIGDILRLDQLTEEQRNILKWQYAQLVQSVKDQNTSLNEYYKEDAHRKNTVCPSCGDVSARGRFKRLKGEINGSSSSSFDAIAVLGTGIGSGRSYGSVNGSMDTEQVNECRSCGHEWEVTKLRRSDFDIESLCRYIRWFTQSIKEAKEVKWDPNDLSSPYNSLAEAQNGELNKMLEGYHLKTLQRHFGELSQELIVWVMQKTLCRAYSIDSSFYSVWEKHEASILDYITTKRVQG